MPIPDPHVDLIARAIHENYLARQTHLGVAMGATRAMVAWEGLDEDKREANRAQARDIGQKLARIGCRIGRGSANRDFAFTDEELEVLTLDEQLRWSTQRSAAGWTYGATRDDAAKIHPLLVPLEQLPPSELDKDRDAVRNIPAVLAAAGLRVIRSRRNPPA